jgi:hypothetical protein
VLLIRNRGSKVENHASFKRKKVTSPNTRKDISTSTRKSLSAGSQNAARQDNYQ